MPNRILSTPSSRIKFNVTQGLWMYDRDCIAERIRIAEEQVGFKLVYHSVEEVDQVKRALDRLLIRDEDGNITGMTRPLTAQEVQWARNERMLCACDAAYFLTRYAMVKDEKNNIVKFKFRDPQKVYFNIIAKLERRGAAIQLQILKSRQLGMCLEPNTKVLTEDLRWVRIDDLKVGDIVIAVDEGETDRTRKDKHAAKMRLRREGKPVPKITTKSGYRKMRNTVVEAKREVYEKAFRLVMEDGRELIATEQHRFLMKQRGGGQPVWRTVGEAREGDSIRFITKPWEESNYEDGWFGGLMDGEGSVGGVASKGSLSLGVAQVEGKVLDRAMHYLEDRGYSYRIESDLRKGGDSSKFGDKPVHKVVLGRMNELFRVFGQCRPARWKQDWWLGCDMPGKKTGESYANIVSIEPQPAQRMIDIQTAAKTFIAEGFVSHNSTITELLVAHRIFFTAGVNAVIASSAQQQTKIMQGMIFLVYDNLPYWMRPREKTRQESDKGFLTLHGTESGVSFQHGSQKTGIARGTTPTIVHLSECAGFLDAENTIEASLFNAVHESPGVFMVLESTAEGNTGWWYETWQASKAGWPKGRSRLCPMFLPWFLGTDINPTETWIQTRPIPDGWVPMKETKAMMAKAKLFVSSSPMLSEVLGEDWEMGARQAWYWEVKYEENHAKGTDKKFLQETPTDDVECFQGDFDSVFGNDLLQDIKSSAGSGPGFQMYAITGEGIEDKFDPDEDDIDYDREFRMLAYQNNKGDTYRWTLTPLKSDCVQVPDDIQSPEFEKALEQVDGKLLIFHEPRAGQDYTIGIDSGKGVGGDSSVITVWAKGKGGVPDIQCAEFASAFVSHIEIFAFVMAIASLYKQHMEYPREPLVSVEVLAADGDTCQLQMRKMGYARFHQFVRYDSKKISKRKSHKMGWFTTSWSRPMLIDGFVHSVKNGWVEIHSPFLLVEMKNFEVHQTSTGREKLEHGEGSHDDRVFGSAIAVFTSHDLDAMVERGKKRYIPANQQHRPQVDVGVYQAGSFLGDRGFSDQVKTSHDLQAMFDDGRFSF